VPREGQHHRRIIPADHRALLAGEIDFEQGPQRRFLLAFGQTVRQLRRDQDDAGFRAGGDVQRRFVARVEHGLFPEDHAMVAREAAHQMLRPLKDEIPSKVRETDQGIVSERSNCRG
jgi:hypothetical protein